MKKVLERLNCLLINSMIKGRFGMLKVTEGFMTLLAFWWSFVLLLPASTFAVSSAYDSMAVIAVEPVWGLFFGVLGLLHLTGFISDKKNIIQFSLMTSTITWLFVGTMMFIGANASTAMGIYMLVALLSASAYFYKGIER